MEDIEFDHLLDYQPSMYRDEDVHNYGFNEWSGVTFLESHAANQPAPIHSTGSGSDDIEHTYTGLHQCVDQVIAKISARTPPRLEQIREQNRKLIEKLTTLECAITRDAADVAMFGFEPCLSTEPTAPVFNARSAGKRRRVSQSTDAGTSSASVPNTPSSWSETSPANNDALQAQSPGHESPSFGELRGDSKLARKLMQIGNDETRAQVREFAAQLKAPELENALPDVYQFAHASRITDVTHFLRLVMDLGLAIESSIFGEQHSRIRKRIALAHFYHAYTVAQDHPEMFLSWCDDQRVQGSSLLPKGGYKSLVQHRFADLIFPRPAPQGGTPSPSRVSDNGDDTKRKIAKIQMWRKSGRKWAQVIQRFGYGILLLLPPSLSDEDLRVAHDKAVACGLDLVESRKHLFADILQQANDLLEAHFFPQEGNAQLTNTQDYSQFQRADWDGLLNNPALGN